MRAKTVNRLRTSSPRRMRPRAKTPMNLKRSMRSHHARRLKKLPAFKACIPTIALVAIGIVAAGVLMAARQPFRQADDAAQDSQTTTSAQADTMAAALTFEATPIAAPEASTDAAAVGVRGAESTSVPKSAPGLALAKSVAAGNPTSELAKSATAAKTAPEPAKSQFVARDGPVTESPTALREAPAPAVTSDVENPVPVTISGCLELTDTTFRLKDTAGLDAPKSRSWRSGFLMRRSSPIELVDPDNTLNLAGHVGQRVAATGTLEKREMRARSLESVSTSCR